MTTAILLNPTAGGGRAAAVWGQLRAAPGVADLPLLVGDDAGDLFRRLDGILDQELERLVVVGGDGTLNLAVNHLLERQREDVILGLVPAGNGSDLVRHLGLPREPRAALANALTGPPRALDALCLTTVDGRRRHAINVLSMGVSGIAGQIVNQGPRRSALTYLKAALTALRRYQPVPCRVLADEETEPWFAGDILLLAVANGAYFGKGMKIAPDARVDDGLAEITLVEPIPFYQIPFKIPRLFLGGLLALRQVHHRQARRLRLEPMGVLPPFDMDGEVMVSARAEIEVLPGKLRVAAGTTG